MSAFAEPLAQARENVDHAEALLTRDPFGEAERSLAATLLREALAALDLIEQRAKEMEAERDAAVRAAEQAQEALRLACADLQDLHAKFLDNRSTTYEPPDDGDVTVLMDEMIARAALTGEGTNA